MTTEYTYQLGESGEMEIRRKTRNGIEEKIKRVKNNYKSNFQNTDSDSSWGN